jgi:SpoVK/Ycf46/Vps4 family AAA+-type ATPase
VVASDGVVDGLRAAVAADPENLDLRAHLAEVLAQRGDGDAAAREAATVLQRDPSHRGALDVITSVAGASTRSSPVASPAPVVGATVTLADVGGLDRVKARIVSDVLAPARDPAHAARFGVTVTGGLLLWGPPGCGKTFVARAVAGELGSSVVPVRVHEVTADGPDAVAARLHDVYEVARRSAPAVVLIDEVDALALKRTKQARSASGRLPITQLLHELDGVDRPLADGVYTLATTNHPWDVDDALIRAGRLDRAVFVPPPDVAAREAIFEHHLAGLRVAGVLHLAELAAATEGLTGADIALVCRDAGRVASRRADARDGPDWIMQEDLVAAARGAVPSSHSWFAQAERHARFSDRVGFYDEMVNWLERGRR